MDHSKFQERLRDYVVKKHISTSQIARQAMISRQTMSNILNHKKYFLGIPPIWENNLHIDIILSYCYRFRNDS